MERVSVFLLLVPEMPLKGLLTQIRSVWRTQNGYTKEKWNVRVTCSREEACCFTEPGGDERVILGGAVQALFALRQGGVEQQVSVGQHS